MLRNGPSSQSLCDFCHEGTLDFVKGFSCLYRDDHVEFVLKDIYFSDKADHKNDLGWKPNSMSIGT